MTKDTYLKLTLVLAVYYDTVNQKYRYYYTSSNHLLFDRAFTVSTNHDMLDFFDKILSLDLINTYYMKRPSSGWILAGLPNIEVRIYRLKGIPIGTGVRLPDYLTHSRSLMSLTHHKTQGYAYNDNMCFFRCLALHLGASLRALESPAKRLREKLEKYSKKSYEEGVEVNMLTAIEDFFKTTINVYSLQENKVAEIVQISTKLFKKVMHLNLYENHFSCISNFTSFAKKYSCTICGRILAESCHLKRHMAECTTEVTEIYCGGKYRNIYSRS